MADKYSRFLMKAQTERESRQRERRDTEITLVSKTSSARPKLENEKDNRERQTTKVNTTSTEATRLSPLQSVHIKM